jgi:predicted SnoaL-like aldol condensation-catalyzing enzyme
VNATDTLLKRQMNADGKVREGWDVLQEIGDPKKTAHANSMF